MKRLMILMVGLLIAVSITAKDPSIYIECFSVKAVSNDDNYAQVDFHDCTVILTADADVKTLRLRGDIVARLKIKTLYPLVHELKMVGDEEIKIVTLRLDLEDINGEDVTALFRHFIRDDKTLFTAIELIYRSGTVELIGNQF